MKAAQPFRIGGVEIPNCLVLGPMAGVTDLAFRRLCREQGAGLLCMEMVSAKGLFYGDRKSDRLIRTGSWEHPISLQLCGSDPEVLGNVAERLSGEDFDLLDFNMGCPMPKIIKNGDGSALMRSPDLAERCISALVEHAGKPVTVKIRKGFAEDHVNAVEIARIAERAGAAAVAVHGRTTVQLYSGQADWEIIRRCKEAVGIPVIGSGDIRSPEDLERMAEETGCDAFMVARAARGNPWIFRSLLTGRVEKPDFHEMAEMLRRHARLAVEDKGEGPAMREMRKHAAWYTAGYPGSAALRRIIGRVETWEGLDRILRAWEKGARYR